MNQHRLVVTTKLRMKNAESRKKKGRNCRPSHFRLLLLLTRTVPKVLGALKVQEKQVRKALMVKHGHHRGERNH